MSSVVPPSNAASGQGMSAKNPAYAETVFEENEENGGEEDHSGAGKAYGSAQNHPMFNRKLSV